MLQCIYHGFSYRGDGSCGSIPQASAATASAATASPRACATVLPAAERDGLLWAWPDGSEDGRREAMQRGPVIIDETAGPEFHGTWYLRDLPASYETIIENLSDPAHLPHAHHGVMLHRSMGGPLGIKLEPQQPRTPAAVAASAGTPEASATEVTAAAATAVETTKAAPERGNWADAASAGFLTEPFGFTGRRNMQVGFIPPSLCFYRTDYTNLGFNPFLRRKKRLVQRLEATTQAVAKMVSRVLPAAGKAGDAEPAVPLKSMISYFQGYVTPTTPGNCRLILRVSRNFTPDWRSPLQQHMSQHFVTDGDTPALHFLERDLEKRLDAAAAAGGGRLVRPTLPTLDRLFFMPTDADKPVRAFHRWFDEAAPEGVPYPPGTDRRLGPIAPREVMLDRYNAHTKHCKTCSGALARLRRARDATAAAAVGAVAVAAACPRGMLAAALAAGSLGAAVGAVALQRREAKFTFVDYVHAVRDN